MRLSSQARGLAVLVVVAGAAGCDGGGQACLLPQAGARLQGETAGDRAGIGLSGVGDVNGDGFDDLVVGAPGGDFSGGDAGGAFLLYGPTSGLTDLAGADVRLIAEEAGDMAGAAVSEAGDVDGDGLDDLAIGGPGETSGGEGAGSVWILSGADLSTDSSAGLSVAMAHLVGMPGDALGTSVQGAGDVDGDGLDELLIGAPGASLVGTEAGAVYLISGGRYNAGTQILNAADRIEGEEPGDRAGASVDRAGDLNGDGLEDALIGAPAESSAGEGAGSVYVLAGPIQTGATLVGADARLRGEGEGAEAGAWVSHAGDVDGDGYDDALVGAPGTAIDGEGAPGAAYLLYGPISGTDGLSSAGARLQGVDDGERAGASVTAAGDLDGDGRADVAIGAPLADGCEPGAGRVYLVRGPVYGSFELSGADLLLYGEATGDNFGATAAPAGDVDGDGLGDVLLGAPYSSAGGEGAGLVYLVYGGVDGI